MIWYMLAFVLSFASGFAFGYEFVVRRTAGEITRKIVEDFKGRESDYPEFTKGRESDDRNK